MVHIDWGGGESIAKHLRKQALDFRRQVVRQNAFRFSDVRRRVWFSEQGRDEAQQWAGPSVLSVDAWGRGSPTEFSSSRSFHTSFAIE